MTIPKTKSEFLFLATRSYESNGSISLREFKEDLRIFNKIERNMRSEVDRYKARIILNLFIIALNQFGNAAIPLALAKLTSEEQQSKALAFFNCLQRGSDLEAKFGLSKDENLSELLRHL